MPDTMSETGKHIKLVESYCTGNGIDVGSGGNPPVPWAIQIDLPEPEFIKYGVRAILLPIQWKGWASDLPFKDRVLDWVHSSHLLEDFSNWEDVLMEWHRVLKVGGRMMISVPDKTRFRAAVAEGQTDNLAHVHEFRVGELSEFFRQLGYAVLRDDFVNDDPKEYSILFIGVKPQAIITTNNEKNEKNETDKLAGESSNTDRIEG